jgi:L-amino acid N-acyltransferase YncA
MKTPAEVVKVQQYLDAIKRGYLLLAEAAERADQLGTTIPQQLANDIEIGRFQASELADAVANDADTMLSPPYLPLTEEAIASQSRALAWVEMAYLDALRAHDEQHELPDDLATVNQDAADAASALSRSWADLWQLVGQANAQLHDAGVLPRTVSLEGATFTLRSMAQNDGPLIVGFARALPEHDLLFLRRDITQPAQVEAWLRDAAAGLSERVLAFREDELVAYATVISDGLEWTKHVRELRVMVAPAVRGMHLGRLLTEHAFAVAQAQGVRKMFAQMTTD